MVVAARPCPHMGLTLARPPPRGLKGSVCSMFALTVVIQGRGGGRREKQTQLLEQRRQGGRHTYMLIPGRVMATITST